MKVYEMAEFEFSLDVLHAHLRVRLAAESELDGEIIPVTPITV